MSSRSYLLRNFHTFIRKAFLPLKCKLVIKHPFVQRHCYLLFIYFYRGEGERREGEKHQCVVASCGPPSGVLVYNLGMCPSLGTEPTTLWFTGRHSIHWATPARAKYLEWYLNINNNFCYCLTTEIIDLSQNHLPKFMWRSSILIIFIH